MTHRNDKTEALLAMTDLRLVADIGGTHVRFALAAGGSIIPGSTLQVRCRDFTSLFAAIEHFRTLSRAGTSAETTITTAVLAVAGPVLNNRVAMTNHSWSFSKGELVSRTGIPAVRLLNDFEAIALSLPYLQSGDYRQIGPGHIDRDRPMSVMGPGTGMGVALCIPVAGKFACVATEGGHTGLAPGNDLELALFGQLLQQQQVISRELLLCGAGLLRIYRTLAQLRNLPAVLESAADIQQMGAAGDDPLAVASLQLFCALLGSAAGDQALSSGSTGGVFIAGGIVPRFVDMFAASDFRLRFEHKPPMADYLQAIATAVITCDNPALIGCANAAINQQV